MLAIMRKEQIKNLILEKKSISVIELAQYFSVSEETVRRDLKALEKEGFLERTHGGAFLKKRVQSNIEVNVLEKLLVENKQLIAKKCKELILNGDSIFLDASTTTHHICNEIMDMNLTVLTNSLKVVNSLAEAENIKVILIGGGLDRSSMSFIGRTATQCLKGYYVDKAFISCRSISIENGVTDSNEKQAEIRQLIIERSSKTYLVADATKFGKISFIKISDFSNINGVIVDKQLPAEWYTYFKQRKIALYECGADE